MNIKEQDIKTGIIDVDSSMLLMRQSFTLVAGVSGSQWYLGKQEQHLIKFYAK